MNIENSTGVTDAYARTGMCAHGCALTHVHVWGVRAQENIQAVLRERSTGKRAKWLSESERLASISKIGFSI